MADDEWHYTFFVNDTDTEIDVWYDGYSHTLKPESVGNILWHTSHRRGAYDPLFELGVRLDHEISLNDLYDNRGIIIFRAMNSFCYSFQTFQWLRSKDMGQVSSLPQWVFEKLRWTKLVNKTDSKIQIEYDRDVYTLEPNHSVFVQWVHENINMINFIPKLRLNEIDLTHNNISFEDLYRRYENEEITILRGMDDTYSLRTLSDEEDLREIINETMNLAKILLLKMEGLLKKVTICDKQCKHLLHKFQEGVGMTVRVLDSLKQYNIFKDDMHLVKFICTKMACCMLEGQELLQFCAHDFNRAAFALSSPHSPSAPTASRFALVLRELDWTVDFILFVAHHLLFTRGSIGDWKWCEKSCRLKYDPESDERVVVEEDSLEADCQRQTADREALWASLKSELVSDSSSSNNPSVFSTLKNGGISSFRTLSKKLGIGARQKDNQEELQGIWKKRLLATSHTSGRSSLPRDWFWISKPDLSEPTLAPADDWFRIEKPDFKVVEHLASGSFKHVNVCNWLGETVAVAVLDVPKEQAEAEASLLARVQHPNVVELRGYAYKDNSRNPHGFLVTELMEQDLESLISQQLNTRCSGATIERPPFALPVAIDISLQIVEAMIHLKKCGVIHRDLKPKNCLASPKFRKGLLPSECSGVPMYYTIKIIDFGAAKMRGQDSYFHTYKQGTPYYMAPEVYGRSEEECPYTWSADVYSFGMTCFEVFTGRAPFKKCTRFKEVQEFICAGGRPEFPFELPSLVKELIERCWAQNPAGRPSFQDIRKDLWQCKLDTATVAESNVIADFNIQFLLPEYDGTHQQAYSSPVDCTEHVSLPYCSPCYSCSSYASSYIGGGREVDGEADEGEGWMVELVEEGEAWMGEADSEANERGGWMVGVDGEVDGEVHVEKDLGRKVDGESDGEVKKAKKADGEVDGEANRERGVDRGADEGEGRTGRL